MNSKKGMKAKPQSPNPTLEEIEEWKVKLREEARQRFLLGFGNHNKKQYVPTIYKLCETSH